MTLVQDFAEVGFPLPRGPIPRPYRAGIDYTEYEISAMNVVPGQEANIQFNLRGVTWPGEVISATAYFEQRQNHRQYFWIDRGKNAGLAWPPQREEIPTSPIRPGILPLPYGTDIEIKPSAATCAANNQLTPYAAWQNSSHDERQCLWQVAGIPVSPVLPPQFLGSEDTAWTSLQRRDQSQPIPISTDGPWSRILAPRRRSVSPDGRPEWQPYTPVSVQAATRWRIIQVLGSSATPPTVEELTDTDTQVRRLRVGLQGENQPMGDIDWTEKTLPDQLLIKTDLRLMVPPSKRFTLHVQVWLPFQPRSARVQNLTAEARIARTGLLLAWHDRLVFSSSGGTQQSIPTLRIRGRSVRVPAGSVVQPDGGVVSPESWTYARGFDEARSGAPAWVVADVLTRALFNYPDTAIDWPSFLGAARLALPAVNIALEPRPSPLNTLAPLLAQGELRLVQRRGIWSLRSGIKGLFGGRQLLDPPEEKTSPVRVPKKAEISWGTSGWAEVERSQSLTGLEFGTDILPWQESRADAEVLGRTAVWPQQDVLLTARTGLQGAMLEQGDFILIDPAAPAITGIETNNDGTIDLTLTGSHGGFTTVRYQTGVTDISPPTAAEELPNGKLRITPEPGTPPPVLRSAVVTEEARRWEVLSVRRRGSLAWSLNLRAAPDPTRLRWIEDGDEGCQLMDSWTLQMDDWPALDSCVGFS